MSPRVGASPWQKAQGAQHFTPLETIEHALPDMLSALEEDETAHDTAHLAVIAFGDDAQTMVPMTPVSQDPSIPTLPRQIFTNYVAVFQHLEHSE
ncbi:hypothetical protein [Nocardia tengchongensis]